MTSSCGWQSPLHAKEQKHYKGLEPENLSIRIVRMVAFPLNALLLHLLFLLQIVALLGHMLFVVPGIDVSPMNGGNQRRNAKMKRVRSFHTLHVDFSAVESLLSCCIITCEEETEKP